MISLEDLTLAEVDEIETISGRSITSFGDDDKPRAGLMIAMAFVTGRRDDPDLTIEKVRAMSMASVLASLGNGPASETSDESRQPELPLSS
jgi:hypothetical protein